MVTLYERYLISVVTLYERTGRIEIIFIATLSTLSGVPPENHIRFVSAWYNIRLFWKLILKTGVGVTDFIGDNNWWHSHFVKLYLSYLRNNKYVLDLPPNLTKN